jgi:exopolysaccharide production protein ExoZ
LPFFNQTAILQARGKWRLAAKEKLLGVQYLRAIAALMVAYYHLTGEIPAYSRALSFDYIISSRRLSAGVDIFFVISGFIMYVTGRKLSPSEFAWRRLIRILPLYWTLTLAVCAVAIVAPNMLHRTDLAMGYVMKSLLFLPYHNPGQAGQLFPLLVPGWTLNYEMAFYALFGLALFAPRWSMQLVFGVLCALSGLGMIWSHPELLDLRGFYMSDRLLLFAAGIALGATYIHLRSTREVDIVGGVESSTRPAETKAAGSRIRIPRWVLLALIVAGFWGVLTNWSPMTRNGWAEITSAVVIVAGVVAWERQFGIPRWRVPLLLGDASYSIYLAHLFAFGIVRAEWPHVSSTPWAFATASMTVALGLAMSTYWLIERPSLRWLQALRRRLPLLSDKKATEILVVK